MSILLVQRAQVRTGWLYQLDSRAKIILFLLLSIAGLWEISPRCTGLLSSLLLLTILWGGVPTRTILKSLLLLLPVVGVTFLYHILFGAYMDGNLSNSTLPDLESRLMNGCVFSLRALLLFLASFMLFASTRVDEFSQGITKLLRPLRSLRVQVNDIGLALSIAIRYIPLLQTEFRQLQDAQRLRGVRFDLSWHKKLGLLSSHTLPAMTLAVSRAEQLALAVQARDYHSQRQRSWLYESEFAVSEIMFVLTWTFVTIAAVRYL